MSERFTINATEAGIVRLFKVNLPPEEIARFTEADYENDGPSPLQTALGVSDIDSDFVELFPVSNLTGLGLASYLVEGLGIPEKDVSPDRAKLNAIDGHVLVVLSQAFGGFEATLTPRSPLTWIGTYVEEGAPVNFAPLPTDSAKGNLASPDTKPAKSNARMSGMVAMYALLAMFALVALMILVGG